jgi:hypothetical protein
MIRIAHCCCGSVRAEVTGEPTLVVACHCMECQRRTGSPFGVGACFPKEQVRTKGPNNVYVRGCDSGREIELHFSAPRCTGARNLSRTLSASPLARSLTR